MCGIVGFFAVKDPFSPFDVLHAIQHRGDEGAGVVFSDGENFILPAPHRNIGLVADCARSWPGNTDNIRLGVGHLRYGTSGKHNAVENIQPFVFESRHGSFCIAHNGDIPDYEALRQKLQDKGDVFISSSDTEVIARMIAHESVSSPNFKEAIASALGKIRGAFSLVMATPDALIAARDPWGFRPLSLGKLGSGYVLASETCALDVIHAEYLRDIEPGEIVWIDENGIERRRFSDAPVVLQHCVFEMIYFSRPDSSTFGQRVYEFRLDLGRKLAEECGRPEDPDALIFGIPDSATVIAQGYAKALGLQTEIALIRHHWADRTFIKAGDKERENGIRQKFNPVKEVIKGRSVVMIDDSLVRGNTMRRLVRMMRACGALQVTVLIASPPIIHPCRYGIDMKTYEELAAAKYGGDIKTIRVSIEADNLRYLSFESLQQVVGDHQNFCFACFDGRYAI